MRATSTNNTACSDQLKANWLRYIIIIDRRFGQSDLFAGVHIRCRYQYVPLPVEGYINVAQLSLVDIKLDALVRNSRQYPPHHHPNHEYTK